jgi:hypothetical protein
MIAPKVKGGETPQLCGRTFAAAADWEVIFFPYTYRFLFLGGLGKKTIFFSKSLPWPCAWERQFGDCTGHLPQKHRADR